MSTIEIAMRVAGYKRPAERDGCRNCAHRKSAKAFMGGVPVLECTRGGYMVSPNAICNHHQLAGIAARKPQETDQ